MCAQVASDWTWEIDFVVGSILLAVSPSQTLNHPGVSHVQYLGTDVPVSSPHCDGVDILVLMLVWVWPCGPTYTPCLTHALPGQF